VVFGGLQCEDIIFEGQVVSEKRVNLLYDEVTRHFHVIANLTGAMSKGFICEGCSKSCRSGVTHKYSEACSDCLSIPPCISTDVRIPCGSCNRTFRSQTCFGKHKTNKLKGKPVCAQKRNCGTCNSLISPMRKQECFKQCCAFCQQNREAGHYCYMRPLANELPKSDNVLFVFYDFETTQDTRLSHPQYTFLIFFALSISEKSAKTSPIFTSTVCAVVVGVTHSGMTPLATS